MTPGKPCMYNRAGPPPEGLAARSYMLLAKGDASLPRLIPLDGGAF